MARETARGNAEEMLNGFCPPAALRAARGKIHSGERLLIKPRFSARCVMSMLLNAQQRQTASRCQKEEKSDTPQRWYRAI
jgi:hypothetical protein